jgi:hypothetical protein
MAAPILSDGDLQALEVVWSGILVASMVLFSLWLAAGASTWLEVAVADSSPRPAYRLGLTIAGILLTVWLGLFYLVYLALIHVNDGGAIVRAISWDTLGQVAASPPTGHAALVPDLTVVTVLLLPVLMLMSVWGFPLAAWLGRGRMIGSSGSPWVLLDGPPHLLHVPRKPPLRPDFAFAVGAVGGLVFCSLSFLANQAVFFALTWPRLVEPVIQAMLGWVGEDNYAEAVWTLVWYLLLPGKSLLAASIQTVVVVIVACRVRRLGGLHGIFAAFVADGIMLCGVVVLDLWSYELVDVSAWTLGTVGSVVLTAGGLLATPVAFGVAALRAKLYRIAPASPTSPERAAHPERSPNRAPLYRRTTSHHPASRGSCAACRQSRSEHVDEHPCLPSGPGQIPIVGAEESDGGAAARSDGAAALDRRG